MYNQYVTSARKKITMSRTNSRNQTLCFFLEILIHVEVLLAMLIWAQYHSKEFAFVSLTKNIFFTSILSKVDGKIRVVIDHDLGILYEVLATYINKKKGCGTVSMDEQGRADGGGDQLLKDTEKNFDICYVIYHINTWILDFF